MSVIDASIREVTKFNHWTTCFLEPMLVHINTTLLFSRPIAIVKREEDKAPFFNYELTTVPTSLFKDNALQKNDKARSLKMM